MSKGTFPWIVLAVLLLAAWTDTARCQVSPEVQLGARGVMSLNTDIEDGRTAESVSDFSDTGLMLGFRQKLYNDYRARLVVGFQFPDAESNLGQVFFHQTFIQMENKSNIMKIGRSRVKTTLFDFPTLRDDDALLLTTVLNPFSSGENSEDHQYGNVLEYSRIFGQRLYVLMHAEHFTETPALPGEQETDFGLNAIGMAVEYRVPETQLWNRPVIQYIGFSSNNFLTVRPTDRPEFTSDYDKTLKNLSFGFVVNMKRDPVHFLDLRSQTIYNTGFNEVDSIGDFGELARAEAIGNYTSIRYLYRKLERPTLQVAISGGYKRFLDAPRPTDLFQVVIGAFYRLGENFDAGVQLQHEVFSGELEEMFGESETRVQLSLIYSIAQSWNNKFDDRDSLLNLEHGYIP